MDLKIHIWILNTLKHFPSKLDHLMVEKYRSTKTIWFLKTPEYGEAYGEAVVQIFTIQWWYVADKQNSSIHSQYAL